MTAGMFNLHGRHVLVAGAAGGIGLACAEVFSAQGARLTLTDLSEQTLRERLDESIQADCIACDTTDRSAVAALIARSGVPDALVDVSGICPYDDWTSDEWDDSLQQVLAVNVRGPLNLVRAVLPAMMQRGNGRIVLTGSLAGRTGGLRAMPHYAASKGAVHALVRWFAARAARGGVLVNGLAPGTIDTPMIRGQDYDPASYPLGRFAKPEEIAAVAAFLCAPASGFMSGTVIDINGGVHMS